VMEYWLGTPGYSRGTARVLECGAAAARPRAERAVPSCAGVYVYGAAGSNECPAGSVRIETEAACRTAVAAAGMTANLDFVETDSDYPRGCYYYYRSYAAIGSSNGPYFNAHPVGAGNDDTQLLCAADTMGAPPPQRRRCAQRVSPPARVCAGTARVLCVAYNETNGLHIDTHTHTDKRYIYAHTIYPYDADGARRRCRAAPGNAGRRRTGVHGHGP
jgi:hypothetical protein